MFSKSEKFYDEIYGAMGKDYIAEANKVHQFIQKYNRTEGNALLDVACGTGAHAGPLSIYYKVEGMDLDADMLKVAHKKYPKIQFHHGDMRNFELGHRFDIITCLFSSIGYMRTKGNLQKAIRSMSRHLLPGGVLLVEPWYAPDQWPLGRVFTLRVDKPDLRIVRMSHGGRRGKISLLEFQYLIGTPKGIENYVEHHELGLFTPEEYLEAFRFSSLKVTYNKKGLDGRGLYIGRKSVE